MAEETLISWADMTFNPWIGCTRVSPACDGCYAAHLMETRMGRVTWGGPGIGAGTRDRTSAGNWRKPVAWDKKAKAEGRRPFVFCSSLADVFDNEIENEWRADLFALIHDTPNLVWLLLTKRPQNIVKLFDAISFDRGAWPKNAAIGTTVEDQKRANTNVPALLVAKTELRPAFAFLSCEPLLGPITVPMIDQIDWVITGGETDQGSHKARPTHPNWFRWLRDQCADAGVAYHHKQNGEWRWAPDRAHFKEAITEPWTRVESQVDGVRPAFVVKEGKKHTGRMLDGVEHNAFPEVSA